MWLLVDDIRTGGNEDVIARTPQAGKELLSKISWEGVILDHDLGDYSTETGYDVLCWALEHNCLPNHVHLITSNPVGRQRMRVALEHACYHTKDGLRFKFG
jgi:hypothetical protein